jgi:hypothetical protein
MRPGPAWNTRQRLPINRWFPEQKLCHTLCSLSFSGISVYRRTGATLFAANGVARNHLTAKEWRGLNGRRLFVVPLEGIVIRRNDLSAKVFFVCAANERTFGRDSVITKQS